MISDFYTTEFEVTRPVWDVDEDDHPISELAVIGTFNGHLQQAGPELIQNLGLSFTKAFTIWCALDTDVLEGDTLEASEISYTVRALQKNVTGGNQHLELVCELDENI